MKIYVHPREPFANGVLFDELHNFTTDQRNLLAGRGVVWATEFQVDEMTYGGTIIATSQEVANGIAAERGLGEKVVGKVVSTGTA